jgi:hypothetical protein
MASLLDPFRELNVESLTKIAPGSLFLMQEQSSRLLALRLNPDADDVDSPTVVFREGVPPRFMRYQPAFTTWCLVLGKAEWRVSEDLGSLTPSGDAEQPGAIIVSGGGQVFLISSDAQSYPRVNLRTMTLTSAISPKWFATRWEVGIKDGAGHFLGLYSFEPKPASAK